MTDRLAPLVRQDTLDAGTPPGIYASVLRRVLASTSITAVDEPVEPAAHVYLRSILGESFWPTTLRWSDPVTIADSRESFRWTTARWSDPVTIADRAIEEAKWILELEDGWDEDKAPAYKEADLRRARRILVALLKEAPAWGIPADTDPDINPAISGGIDLCWDSEDASMAVNVSTDPNGPITFYRERRGGLAGKGWILEK